MRSTVEALTLRTVLRMRLFDHARQSNTRAMLLMSSEASTKLLIRARGAVTTMFAVAPAVRLGRSLVVSGARLRVPTDTVERVQNMAGAASGSPNNRSASNSICPSTPTAPKCTTTHLVLPPTLVRGLRKFSSWWSCPRLWSGVYASSRAG